MRGPARFEGEGTMIAEEILSIGIDDRGSLWVKPALSTFPMIYREAMEIGWDSNHSVLFCPKPLKWDYVRWFRQVLTCAHLQGVGLTPTPQTVWINIDQELANNFKVAAAEVWRSLGTNSAI